MYTYEQKLRHKTAEIKDILNHFYRLAIYEVIWFSQFK